MWSLAQMWGPWPVMTAIKDYNTRTNVDVSDQNLFSIQRLIFVGSWKEKVREQEKQSAFIDVGMMVFIFPHVLHLKPRVLFSEHKTCEHKLYFEAHLDRSNSLERKGECNSLGPYSVSCENLEYFYIYPFLQLFFFFLRALALRRNTIILLGRPSIHSE